MILVTHAVVGAALTHTISGALGAFFVAFASHYIFDMIPHWHYSVPQVKRATEAPFGKRALVLGGHIMPDLIRIAVDASLGMTLALVFFKGSVIFIAAAAFGAMLPDFLVGLAKFYPQRVLVWHDRFHRWIHTPVRLDDRPLLGITTQAALIAFCIFFFR